jgi:outer membrane lipoprotein-sorting protein
VRSAFFAVSIFSAACAPRLMKLPAGPGAPASDAATAIAEATAACRDVSSLSAEVAVSGSVGGQRVRGRLLAGVAAPASARLEAVAPFGQPLFIFVSTGGDATLLLPRDNRVLEHGRSDAILEAIAGVPLDAAALRRALTGCASAPDAARAQQFGDDWRVVPDADGDVYLRRDARTAPWHIVAVLHRQPAEWRAEYHDFAPGGLPRTVRFRSGDAKRFDLQLALSQVDVNPALGPEAFRVTVPRDAEPISLQELRASGPLGGAPSKSDAR